MPHAADHEDAPDSVRWALGGSSATRTSAKNGIVGGWTPGVAAHPLTDNAGHQSALCYANPVVASGRCGASSVAY